MTIPTREIPINILDILAAATVEGNVVTLNSGQLDRADYVAVNRVLEALGGKWNRRVKGHVFDDDPSDRLADVVTTGSYQHPDDLGWFPTPEPLARRVVELAELRDGMEILEPSAGEGALADAATAYVDPLYITCIEIDQWRANVLERKGYRTHCMDFGDWGIGDFDRIIMNPPFAKQQDVDHVMGALSLLKPGGRLVAITSLGLAFRQDRKTVALREFIDAHGWYEANPDDAFKESGTNVRTMTIVVDIPEAA